MSKVNGSLHFGSNLDGFRSSRNSGLHFVFLPEITIFQSIYLKREM